MEHESLADSVFGQCTSFPLALLRLVSGFQIKHLSAALLQSQASSFNCHVREASCNVDRTVASSPRLGVCSCREVGHMAVVRLLEVACGELKTCVICDTLVRRLVLARGPHALQCVRLFREGRQDQLPTH